MSRAVGGGGGLQGHHFGNKGHAMLLWGSFYCVASFVHSHVGLQEKALGNSRLCNGGDMP